MINYENSLRSRRGSERGTEAAAHHVEDDAKDEQQSPNHHDVLDVESACVHPAPDESPDPAGDDADDAVHHATLLKLLNQDDDETDETCDTTH